MTLPARLRKLASIMEDEPFAMHMLREAATEIERLTERLALADKVCAAEAKEMTIPARLRREARVVRDYSLFASENELKGIATEIERLTARNAAMTDAIKGLFDYIKHGDDAHQIWLYQMLEAHFCGFIDYSASVAKSEEGG